MARYTTAQALRLIMEEDSEPDEDSVAEGDADDSEDGDYLPEVGTASDNEDHVSEESEESEDVSASDEERVKEPSTTRNTRGRACIYSCKRKINRWPMVLFFDMLDTAAIASFVIWMCNNPDWNKSSKAIRRRQFIISLGESLAEPLIRRRLDKPALLRGPIMDAIQLIELDSGEFEAGTEIPAKVKRTQGRCHLCPRECDRKTRKFCDKCSRPACPAHSVNNLSLIHISEP